MKMKITPEQNKAVQSYINYMLNLYNKPQALPPPKTKINKRTKATSNTQEFFVDSNGVARPVNASAQRNNTSLPHPNTRRLGPPSNAAQNVTSNNNPFYNSIWTFIKDNPKTSYTALASLFSAPVLYSMFGGSEEASSGTVPDGTNADSINYKLLANKAKQDINKEYGAAHNKTTNVNTGTDTKSAPQNTNNNLEQLNKLDTRIDANMAKLKALEAETLRRIQEQQANQKLPQNPQSGNVWGTYSGNTGIFDTSTNYTPIIPNNPMLPYTPIPTNNGINNLAENIVNAPIGQGTTQGSTTPEKKEKPVTDDNKGTGTALGNSVKNIVNQNTKKNNNNSNNSNNSKGNNSKGNTGRVDTKYTPYTPVEIPGFNAAEHIKNNPEFAMPKQEFSNNTGSTSQPTKTALNESQSDYYRYLTGYKRMSPKLAIASMGLDPNKYYYQHDPAYYH